MDERKSFLLDLAETIDRHLPRRAKQDGESAPTPGRLRRFLLTQVTHTFITLAVLAAVLVGAVRVDALRGVLFPSVADAGTSFTTINYQGRLAGADGTPIDNTNPGLGITFALYDTDTGGTPLWTETHANVPVSDGLFSVRLGSVTPLDTGYLTGDRWLGIQVGSDPEMTPREKLAAVPYAMRASVADQLADASFASNNVGVHYSEEKTLDEAEYLPFEDFEHTIDVPVRSYVFVVASASLQKMSGEGYLYADLRRDGEHFVPNTTRYLGNIPNLSNWAWNTVEILDPGTYTYQMYVRGTTGLGIRWYRPQISVVVIPVQ